MSIELRLSNVDPPEPDPPRTIYRDVLNLPDPVKIGITIRYFNYDDVTLYFKVTGEGAGYTFGTVELGALGSGQNAYENLDEFGSRAKPSAGEFTDGEFDEDIKLILRAYTDAGYSNLKWTHERIVSVHWIKSDDASFTVDFLNNFDDGTVQGWAVADELNNNTPTYPQIAVASDYVLSAPYSVKMTQGSYERGADGRTRARLYKSFLTPTKNKVFGILDVRTASTSGAYNNYIKIQRDTNVLVIIGEDSVADADQFPKNKWMRTVVPLPKNVTIEVRVVHQYRSSLPAPPPCAGYLWMDDFKIISKD